LGFNYKTGALIWMIGALSKLTYIIIVNIMLWISIKKSNRCDRQDVNKILQESKLKLKVHSKVSIIYDQHLKSPAVYGIIRPKILISENIIHRLTSEELRFVLLHEVTHIKRKDLIVNLFIMLLQVIYWFNPIIWYSLHQFKQDCEVACDATALTVLTTKEVVGYGQTIINMLKILSKSNLPIGTLGFSNKYSKRRIIMITLFNKKSITWTVAALSLVLMIGCSSITKPSNDSNDKSNTEVSNISNVKPEADSDNTSSTNASEGTKDISSNLNSSLLDNIDTTNSSFEKGYYDYQGTINNNISIQMSVYPLGKDIVGSYFYESKRKEMKLKGKSGAEDIVLYEYDDTGKNTGIFKGKMKTIDKIEGTWMSADNKTSYPFTLLLKSNLPGVEYGKRYSIAVGTQGDQNVENFVAKIQGYIVNDNKKLLAEQVKYPINVKINDKVTEMQNANDFIENYEKIINPAFKQVIGNAFTKYMFANWKGVMFGSGSNNIWINNVTTTGDNLELMIISINN
jgi:beta-lactamase regulating signal transducer with metallopeptidase domain